jgi:hypothetical protein
MSSKLLFQTEVELYSTSQAFLETQEHMWQNPYSKIRKKKHLCLSANEQPWYKKASPSFTCLDNRICS